MAVSFLLSVFKVSVLLYHGPQKERMDLVKKIRQAQGPLKMCPVVVTSFEIAMRDRKLLQVNRSGVAFFYSHTKFVWSLVLLTVHLENGDL